MAREFVPYVAAFAGGVLGAFALSFVRGYRVADAATGEVYETVRTLPQAGVFVSLAKQRGKNVVVLDALGRDVTMRATVGNPIFEPKGKAT